MYQARMPECKPDVTPREMPERCEDMEEFRWQPKSVLDGDLMMYLRAARSVAAFAGMCDGGSTEDGCQAAAMDDTTMNAMNLLHRYEYDTGKALQALVKAPALRTIDKKWNEEDTKRFVKGLRVYSKNFFMIRKELLPQKETGDLVEYYYYWKKTPAAAANRPHRRHRRHGIKRAQTRSQRPASSEFLDISSGSDSDNDSDDSDGVGSGYRCHNCLVTVSKDWSNAGKPHPRLCTKCRLFFKKYGIDRPIEATGDSPYFQPVKDGDLNSSHNMLTRQSRNSTESNKDKKKGSNSVSSLDNLDSSSSESKKSLIPSSPSALSTCSNSSTDRKKKKRRKASESSDKDKKRHLPVSDSEDKFSKRKRESRSESESISDSSISGAEETPNDGEAGTNAEDLTSSSPPTTPSPLESDYKQDKPTPVPISADTEITDKLSGLPRPEPQHPPLGLQNLKVNPLFPLPGQLSVSSAPPLSSQGFVPLPPLPAFAFRPQGPLPETTSIFPRPPFVPPSASETYAESQKRAAEASLGSATSPFRSCEGEGKSEVSTVNPGVIPVSVSGLPGNPGSLPVSVSGLPVTTVGMPLNPGMLPVNAACLPVSTNGLPVSASGLPLSASGLPMSASGMPMNTSGIPMNVSGLPLTASGMPLSASGLPMNSSGMPVSASGLPMNAGRIPETKVKEEPGSHPHIMIKQEPRDSLDFLSQPGPPNVALPNTSDSYAAERKQFELLTPKREPGLISPPGLNPIPMGSLNIPPELTSRSNPLPSDLSLTSRAEVKGQMDPGDPKGHSSEGHESVRSKSVEIMEDSDSDREGTLTPGPVPTPCNKEIFRSKSAIFIKVLNRGEHNSCARSDLMFKAPADSKLARKKEERERRLSTPHTPNKEESTKRKTETPTLNMTPDAHVVSNLPASHTSHQDRITPRLYQDTPALRQLSEYAKPHALGQDPRALPGYMGFPPFSMDHIRMAGMYPPNSRERLELELERDKRERDARERDLREQELRTMEMREKLKAELEMKHPGLDRLLPPGANPLDPHWLEMQRRFGPHMLPGSSGSSHIPGVYPPTSLASDLMARERERLERLDYLQSEQLTSRMIYQIYTQRLTHEQHVYMQRVSNELVMRAQPPGFSKHEPQAVEPSMSHLVYQFSRADPMSGVNGGNTQTPPGSIGLPPHILASREQEMLQSDLYRRAYADPALAQQVRQQNALHAQHEAIQRMVMDRERFGSGLPPPH